jgi:hypothetical protein
MPVARTSFTAIISEGGLLPSDFLALLLEPKSDIVGRTPADYHLAEDERIGDQVNRSWNRLKGCWESFKKSVAGREPGASTTSETRDRWLLPLFQELGYGRLQNIRSLEAGGKTYEISHEWRAVPFHLVGSHVDLDRRMPGATGASRGSPHSLLQQVLNVDEKRLWGIVSNGFLLRVLRDNSSLTRQAFVEFDLQSILDGDLYSEFYVLWLLAHQSRFESEDSRPATCWLEKWKEAAGRHGFRALELLRPSVERAITALGQGLLAHPRNDALRAALAGGKLSREDFYREILRAVYRLIFLFVAEDRGLLHPPVLEDAGDKAREAAMRARRRYAESYSLTRLRGLRMSRAGTSHPDLWLSFGLVCRALGSDEGCTELALPALGSFLWSHEATGHIDSARVSNRQFLTAVHSIAFVEDNGVRRPVDYRNLGSEELGSVYEGLLELHPDINPETRSLELGTSTGSERKTTGSYYTPDSLVQCLLDSALEPVVADAVKGASGEEAAKAILALKVCDPAVGSGHFLIGAAHRMAKHVARHRAGEEEPSPRAVREALREVVGRCLYGVDINPMSAELCKVSLWMEAMEPGKPLSFLDHHIQVGNSLLGATPGLITRGIPDEAFEPIEGDDTKVCSALKRRNKQERAGQQDMLHLMAREPAARYLDLADRSRGIEEISDSTVEGVRRKQDRYARLIESPEYNHARLIADAWCAAFVWEKVKAGVEPVTEDAFHRLQSHPDSIDSRQQVEIRRLAGEFKLFHWHLAFPEVFQSVGLAKPEDSKGWNGGFDVVLGNPPWERVKLEEKQWFESRSHEIAEAKTAALRKQMIRQLAADNPALLVDFKKALRSAEGESRFLRSSGRFPMAGVGDVNTYAVFTELASMLTAPLGMAGIIIPTGLLTDDQLKAFSSHLMEIGRLSRVFGFENEEFLFPGIANVVRYCAVAIPGPQRPTAEARMAFYMRKAEDMSQTERFFSLSAAELSVLNPKTRTCPIFRSNHDAQLTLKLYKRFPVLNPADPQPDGWCVNYLRMFDMANDSGLFLQEPAVDALPLYEAKLLWHYDHRFGSYDLKGKLKGKGGRGLPDMPLALHQDPHYRITPQFWVSQAEVMRKLEGIWEHRWLLAYRKTSSAKLERTVACAVLPLAAVNDKAPIILPRANVVRDVCLLLSCLNSIVLDYIARQKVGGTDIGYFHLDQLPIPRPSDYDAQAREFLTHRVLELSYTSWEMEPFARDCGFSGSPFRWDPDRRFRIQCEIDAFYAHLYGLSRDEVMFVLDPCDVFGPTFPGESFRVLREKETERYGEFRTKQLVMAYYDAMAEAIRTGTPYQTRIDPPPADPGCCHAPRTKG